MATPTWQGKWFDANSPWNTPIPSGCPVHADTNLGSNLGMVQGVYLGTRNTTTDVHAFAYRPAEMTTKWGSIGTTFMKWCGPGHMENFIYSPIGTPTITVWIDAPTYKVSSLQVPMPFNWTGYNSPGVKAPTYFERRTTVVSENGDLYYLYGVTPPGDPVRDNPSVTDTEWHATNATKDAHGGWTGLYPSWPHGGSGLPPSAGTIRPFDILNTPTGGSYGHAIGVNAPFAADGSYTGPNGAHPKLVWPAPFLIYGIHANTDGKTQTAVGIPHGSRIFLDPTMTDADFISLGITVEWQLQIARTLRDYGMMSKESMTGQGEAGGLICESLESIAWNIAHGFYPSGFKYPWMADGTTDFTDKDNSTYNAALPVAIMPESSSRWKVADWNQSVPGITEEAGTTGGGGGGGGATPAFVNEVTHAIIGFGGATPSISISAAPAAGDLVVLSLAWNDATNTLTSVTDSKGNTWTVDQQVAGATTSESVAVASTVQNVGTLTVSDTITPHFSSGPSHLTVAAHEFSGTTNTVDQAASNNAGTGTVRDGGTTAVTANANDLVWASYGLNGLESGFTPGTGFSAPTTSFYAESHSSLEFEYQIVSATGAQHGTGTGGLSFKSVGVTVVYKASSAGPPSNTVAPVASGTATVGSSVSVTNGTWTGTPTGFTYQWQRDASGNEVFSNISAATSSSYTLVSADDGCNIRCVVTATNTSGSTSANSNELGVTQPDVPTNTVQPAVTGTPTVGQVLTSTTGTWTDDGSGVFTYQWMRDTFNDGLFVQIIGATSSTYTLVDADDGCNVKCFVTDTDGVGPSTIDSNRVGLIVEPVPANTVAPVLSGTAQVNSGVNASTGTWTHMGGNNPSYAYQWQDSADGSTGWANITGATSSSYSVGSGELAKFVRCVVTATNSGGSAGSNSGVLGPVSAAPAGGHHNRRLEIGSAISL